MILLTAAKSHIAKFLKGPSLEAGLIYVIPYNISLMVPYLP